MTPKGFGLSSWKHGIAVDWVGKSGEMASVDWAGSQELAFEHISSEMPFRLIIYKIK